MSRTPSANAPETLRLRARHGVAQQQPGMAETAFRELLQRAPGDLEALLFVASRHFARSEPGQALALLDTANGSHPDDPGVQLQRGATQLALGQFAEAAVSLRAGLAHRPEAFMARLQLGIALEQSGSKHEALLAYYAALRTAQRLGRWLDDATTAPALRDTVGYATRYVLAERHALFDRVLEPLRERYGAASLKRVEHSLAMHLGIEPMERPDPRQQSRFFHFAGIPSQPYYDRARFPWLDPLEQAMPMILGELQQLLQQHQPLEAFLGAPDERGQTDLLRAHGNAPAAWDAWFFSRSGHRYDAHCEHCPTTSGLLDSLPLVRIRDHAPETLFSVLRPGTHILPHRGVTNTRLVTHLPLIVPPDCALRVGGELHVWQTGRCVTFDDTYEHEAWNRSDQSRVVLILDTWNPDLAEAERAAVTDLVEAIGDFNDVCEIIPVM